MPGSFSFRADCWGFLVLYFFCGMDSGFRLTKRIFMKEIIGEKSFHPPPKKAAALAITQQIKCNSFVNRRANLMKRTRKRQCEVPRLPREEPRNGQLSSHKPRGPSQSPP